MKKSLLITNDFPPVIGGISTVFYNVWRYYPHDRMLVLTPRAEGSEEFDKTAYFRPLRFRTFSAGGLTKIITIGLMTFLTFRHVFFNNVRDIHAGHILSYGPIGWLFQKVFNIPCFLWVYGGETSNAYKRSKIETLVVSMLLKSCAYLVTNSTAVTNEFLDYGIPRDRIIEIIPAVDSDLFTPGLRPAHLIERHSLEGKQILLTVARLVRKKGHIHIIEALPRLIARFPELLYVIIGRGPYMTELVQKTEELGLENYVKFLGALNDVEIVQSYNSCEIFILPSVDSKNERLKKRIIEGFPVVFTEANLAGKPVIGGRSGGTAEAIIDGKPGLLIDALNQEEVIGAITKLLSDPAYAKKLGEFGRTRAREFDWKIINKKIEEVVLKSVL